MEKMIVWFTPKDKKIGFNQIHVLAENVNNAMEIAINNIPFEVKLMGVGNYRIVNGIDNFINLKLY